MRNITNTKTIFNSNKINKKVLTYLLRNGHFPAENPNKQFNYVYLYPETYSLQNTQSLPITGSFVLYFQFTTTHPLTTYSLLKDNIQPNAYLLMRSIFEIDSIRVRKVRRLEKIEKARNQNG
ncbi:hypothetical protein [Sphingobacterium sp. MYb388]|uniref:hypothetical protein n=1 Tax=Sphingobacterium sp. MYb388 TaxID=2745437 RepID=UPI0030B73DD9